MVIANSLRFFAYRNCHDPGVRSTVVQQGRTPVTAMLPASWSRPPVAIGNRYIPPAVLFLRAMPTLAGAVRTKPNCW